MNSMVTETDNDIQALIEKIRQNQDRINKLRAAAKEGGVVDGNQRFVANESVIILSD